jgi:hypothetical protein
MTALATSARVDAAQVVRWAIPRWSLPAALRAVRAVVVVCGLFAIASQVIDNAQIATFCAFGGFATLVLSSFNGTWRDKLLAHIALALTGSALLTIATIVSSSTVLAALVTVPVTFLVFFAGITGPNAASGVTGALLAYVLPAASAGTIGMVPDRLIGWWMASVVGTAAVLLLSPRQSANQLGIASSKLATALADELDAFLRGEPPQDHLEAAMTAKSGLLAQFTGAPYRPTGLAASDQALASCIELLEWCTSLIADAVRERHDLSDAAPADRELIATSSSVLRDTATLLAGGSANPDVEELERRRTAAIVRLEKSGQEPADFRDAAEISFHANAVAVTVLGLAYETMIATASPIPNGWRRGASGGTPDRPWRPGPCSGFRGSPPPHTPTRAFDLCGSSTASGEPWRSRWRWRSPT